jgi:hypothetical protein
MGVLAMSWLHKRWFEDGDSCDPLYLFRGRPVEDEQADLIEAICLAATPGPWVVDNHSEGGGALVATLADGRHIVSTKPAESCFRNSRFAAAANAQLICEARCLLLRLLHDRQQWKRREKCLLEKINELEEQLERHSETVEQAKWVPADQTPARPR